MPPERIWILLGKKKNGEASPAELEELESLLKEHPDLGFTNELIEKLWDSPLGTVPETQISRNVWFSIQDKLSSEKNKLGRLLQINSSKKWIAAAVFLVAISSPWAIYRAFKEKSTVSSSQHATNFILTQPGSKSKIEL